MATSKGATRSPWDLAYISTFGDNVICHALDDPEAKNVCADLLHPCVYARPQNRFSAVGIMPRQIVRLVQDSAEEGASRSASEYQVGSGCGDQR